MSEEFGNRLKELRQSLGLSQTQCAKHFGISTPAWLYWEKGSREPSISVIVKMCEFFSVTSDVLLGIAPLSTPIPIINASGHTAIAVGAGASANVNISPQKKRTKKSK